MNVYAIDLSMRSTGVTWFNDKFFTGMRLVAEEFLKDEELFIHNVNEIIDFISKPDIIAIEGLSYNSISADKDKIAGQFWYLRIKLKEQFPDAKIIIVPVKEWRNPLFNKDENKILREAKKKYKTEKKKIKGLKGPERKEAMKFNKILEESADIKIATFNKLTDDVKKRIIDYVECNEYEKKAVYDLTDSFYLNSFINKIYC